ncbi:MAG: sorbosone dehydrogenase family protein [Alphaproteobacteria bacterium]|nr:MAG: sorbosone dehydrogenase family protein [Alphaproteobacteria bacterium]
MNRAFLLTGGAAAVLLGAAFLFWPAVDDPLKDATIKGPFKDFLSGAQIAPPDADHLADRFSLPPGFHIGLYARDIPNARGLALTPTGDLIVASMRPGNIVLLHADSNRDGQPDGRTTIVSGLNFVHSALVHDGYLYVAENDRIRRMPFDSANRVAGPLETVLDGLPTGGHHRTRTLGIGPDGFLYVTVGSSCNACADDHAWRATMLRLRPAGGDVQIFASGLRNTVGFDWQPGTGKLYGTDNGRDLLGDDIPNCELNLIEEGRFYGWPYAYDNRVPDPDMGAGHAAEIEASVSPVHGFGAHRAPLGMHFLTPGQEPPGFEGAALVAEHGSWNRSTLAGYKVVSLHFGRDGTIQERDFLTGFEHGEQIIGRPVDALQGADGAIYISDDYAGTVYRISWGHMVATDQPSVATTIPTDPLAGLDVNERALLETRGKALFADLGCGQCHVTADAAPGVQVKELTNLGARHDIAGLEALLKAPPGPMPLFDLTDDERRALAVWLLSTRP